MQFGYIEMHEVMIIASSSWFLRLSIFAMLLSLCKDIIILYNLFIRLWQSCKYFDRLDRRDFSSLCCKVLCLRILGANGVSCQSAKTSIHCYLLAGDVLRNYLDINWLYWFPSAKRVESQGSPWLWFPVLSVGGRASRQQGSAREDQALLSCRGRQVLPGAACCRYISMSYCQWWSTAVLSNRVFYLQSSGRDDATAPSVTHW